MIDEVLLHHTVHLLQEIIPVFLFAVIASAVIDEFIPDAYIEKHFSNENKFISVFNASFLGALIPICTCGMIPLAIKLYRKGLSPLILTAFMVAGNASSIPAIWMTTVISYKIALLRFVTAVIYGVAVAYLLGFIAQISNYKFALKGSQDEHCHDHGCGTEHKHKDYVKTQSRPERIAKIFNDIKSMVIGFLPWILFAVLVAAYLKTIWGEVDSADHPMMIALQSALVYKDWGLPALATVIAFPFYFCAGSDIPLSQQFLSMGFGTGSVIAFMLASPGINLTSFLVYREALGWRAALALVFSSILIVYLLGILVNAIGL